ncbi:helix-turn-helix domain-containing protein [Musicola paradisiaca]|uniref:Arabinose operon regulatory protein n=1 Tax=Musicola paradisiaca (strain Ech703) TaxID=579405 RepID=C6CDT5_MUSP7|nr:helix-turn-helix domain-containing protein [Musicola paradisiaca]ACS85202.1 transcriptional regulator, AraC family [Musicola paradisiaca Ech703]
MNTTIPAYALYGEQSELSWENFFNVEHLSFRSRSLNWKVSPHVHESLLQVLFIQQGDVDVLLNYTRFKAHAPCLILIPAQTVHGLEYTPDSEGLTITASQKPLESTIALLAPNVMKLVDTPCIISLAQTPDDCEVVQGYYQAMVRELRIPNINQIAMGMSLLTSLFLHLARISGQVVEPQEYEICSRKTAQINKFLQLVDQRFRQRLSVNDYACKMGMSPGHLSRLCREALGMSSLDVINMRVIQEAQRDLVYTAKTIKQLAASLGFNDEAYFTRFFHKHAGVSPTQFRELAVKQIVLSENVPNATPGHNAKRRVDEDEEEDTRQLTFA